MPQQRVFVEDRFLRLIVVGHGPSVFTGRGSLIDTMTVVRLKRGLTDPLHRGVRTDYLCARSPRFDHGKYPFWLSEKSYGGMKATTGLSAVLEAVDRLNPKEIFVIGFDRLMHPEREDPPHTWLAHDKWAEYQILRDLGVRELG